MIAAPVDVRGWTHETWTDEWGRFEFVDLTNDQRPCSSLGTWSVGVLHHDWRLEERWGVDVPASEPLHLVVVPRSREDPGSARLLVDWEAGPPAGEVRVEPDSGGAHERLSGELLEVLDLRPGHRALEVFADGFVPARVTVFVEAGKRTEPVRLTMRRWRTLRVRVVDSTGALVPGAFVGFRDPHTMGLGREVEPGVHELRVGAASVPVYVRSTPAMREARPEISAALGEESVRRTVRMGPELLEVVTIQLPGG